MVAATGVLALFQDLAISRAFVAEAPTGVGGAIFGTLLLEGYFLVRYVQRKRGIQVAAVLPGFAFPAVAVIAFGGLAAWLAAHAALRAADGGGPGSLLGGAVACAAVAAWYVPRLRAGLAAEAG